MCLGKNVNQLLRAKDQLSPCHSDVPICPGYKPRRPGMGLSIGRTTRLTPNLLADDWLDILRDATLELVSVARSSDLGGMLPEGHL
jgi:hypothetical protein